MTDITTAVSPPPSPTTLLENLEKQKAELEKLVTSVQSCITHLHQQNNSETSTIHEGEETITAKSSSSDHEVGPSQFHNELELLDTLSKDISTATSSLHMLKQQLDNRITNCTSRLQKLAPTPPKWPWPLSPTEYRRYARQLIMPEVGLAGQVRLKHSSALIIGAGGLGCPAAAYLAGAGIGTIGVVDGDVVEESNLHRQVLHDTTKIGVMKVDSVIEAMRRINPLPTYNAHCAHLTPESALDILDKYDVVLDCTDNPATRYLISDACVLLGKPLVSASALRADGQLSILNYPPAPPGSTITTTKQSSTDETPQSVETPTGGPCYRCIWPTPPPPSAVTTCGEGGILGPVVGVMGVLQALETIKILASPPRPEVPGPASMLLFSAYPTLSFRSIRLRTRRANCAACSAVATVSRESLISGSLDYVAFCGGLVGDVNVLPASERLDAETFVTTMWNAQKLEVTSSALEKEDGHITETGQHITPFIIDVREKPVYDIFHIKNSINLPYSQLTSMREVSELPGALVSQENKKDMLLLCSRGNDSQYSVLKLRQLLSTSGSDTVIQDVSGGWTTVRREVGRSAQDWPEF